jgi:hypothetical protein
MGKSIGSFHGKLGKQKPEVTGTVLKGDWVRLLINVFDRVQISKLNFDYAIVILLFWNFFYPGKKRQCAVVKRES